MAIQPDNRWMLRSNSIDFVAGKDGSDTNITYTFGGKAVAYADFSNATARIEMAYDSMWDIGTDPFSIALWVSGTQMTGIPEIIIRVESDLDRPRVKVSCSAGRMYFTLIDAGGEQYAIDDTAFMDGSWYHFVLTRSGTTATIYKNGVEATYVARSTTKQPSLNPDEGFNFGKRGLAGHSAFSGKMADVMWFDEALSEAQAKKLYLSYQGHMLMGAQK